MLNSHRLPRNCFAASRWSGWLLIYLIFQGWMIFMNARIHHKQANEKIQSGHRWKTHCSAPDLEPVDWEDHDICIKAQRNRELDVTNYVMFRTYETFSLCAIDTCHNIFVSLIRACQELWYLVVIGYFSVVVSIAIALLGVFMVIPCWKKFSNGAAPSMSNMEFQEMMKPKHGPKRD